MKFGGTSVGSPARMKEVARLVTQSGEPVFVVLSAMSGTTNELVEMSNRLYKKNTEGAHEIIDNLEQKYLVHINELYSTEEYRQAMRLFLNERMNYLRSFTDDLFTSFEEKNIVAQGEILSTTMITNFLCEQGVKAALIPALDFMRTDKNADPDQFYIKEKLAAIMTRQHDKQVYITQGFICLNAYGEVDNLQRGGSDYTASLVGAALPADEIQIWTDIDGMHNNDPRVVENTTPVRQLHFEEASELAFFGAKILHPTCVQPASVAGIPIRLKNTMQPNAPGTIINNHLEHGKVKAVAAKDNIIAIRVESSRRLGSASFLRKVFEVFESYQTPVDMVATSEVGVSMTIENTNRLNDILDELCSYGSVSVERNMCIVCVVGDLNRNTLGNIALITTAIQRIPVRMISYGGSDYAISFLISQDDKAEALRSLSKVLFQNKES